MNNRKDPIRLFPASNIIGSGEVESYFDEFTKGIKGGSNPLHIASHLVRLLSASVPYQGFQFNEGGDREIQRSVRCSRRRSQS